MFWNVEICTILMVTKSVIAQCQHAECFHDREPSLAGHTIHGALEMSASVTHEVEVGAALPVLATNENLSTGSLVLTLSHAVLILCPEEVGFL
jgi:hypothetical protein